MDVMTVDRFEGSDSRDGSIRTGSGGQKTMVNFSLNAKTFHEMVRIHPQVSDLRELMDSVSKMRLNSLIVGRDGFNRCMLSAFGQKASRNSPSNAKFIFGPSCWMRGLIKPPEGWAVAYLDWEQQEFGIAAALSNDHNMIDDYNSGDAYLGFAKRAKAIPEDGTKKSHRKFVIYIKLVSSGSGTQWGSGHWPAESINIFSSPVSYFNSITTFIDSIGTWVGQSC